MGQGFYETGIFPWTKGADFSGPLAVCGIFQDGLLGSGQSCIVANWLDASLIRSNTFEGDDIGPLVVLSGSSNNTLLENRDLRPTIPPESPTYFLDRYSSGNLILGASGTAQDEGTDNKIFLHGPGRGM